MRIAAYVVLFALAGCSQGACRSTGGTEARPGQASAAVTAVAAPDKPDRDGLDVSPDAGGRGEPPDPGGQEARHEPGEQDALAEQLAPLRRGGRYLVAQPPDDAEEQAYRAWIAGAALAARDGRPPPAAPPGFVLREVPGRALWLLAEDGPRRRGTGAIVLRTGPAAPLIVEAPHTFFDQGTLPIALAIFEAQRARALIINTSHRYGGRPKPDHATPGGAPDDVQAEDNAPRRSHATRSGRGPAEEPRGPAPAELAFADVAHADRSFFLSAHRALIETYPGLPTVQLHGFQDRSAPGAAAIVSAVGRGADLERLLAPLRASVTEGKVLAYPAEINKLGGSTNVQARWSLKLGAAFYHVELSRSLRDRLTTDTAFLRRFAAAFSGIAAVPERGAGGDRGAPGAAR